MGALHFLQCTHFSFPILILLILLILLLLTLVLILLVVLLLLFPLVHVSSSLPIRIAPWF